MHVYIKIKIFSDKSRINKTYQFFYQICTLNKDINVEIFNFYNGNNIPTEFVQ